MSYIHVNTSLLLPWKQLIIKWQIKIIKIDKQKRRAHFERELLKNKLPDFLSKMSQFSDTR